VYYVIGKDSCSYCQKAKELLDKDHTQYVYKNLNNLTVAKRKLWEDLIKNELSRTTLPVVINVVGGYKDLEDELSND